MNECPYISSIIISLICSGLIVAMFRSYLGYALIISWICCITWPSYFWLPIRNPSCSLISNDPVDPVTWGCCGFVRNSQLKASISIRKWTHNEWEQCVRLTNPFNRSAKCYDLNIPPIFCLMDVRNFCFVSLSSSLPDFMRVERTLCRLSFWICTRLASGRVVFDSGSSQRCTIGLLCLFIIGLLIHALFRPSPCSRALGRIFTPADSWNHNAREMNTGRR